MIRDGEQAADRPNERASDGIEGIEVLDEDDILPPVITGALRAEASRREKI